MQIDNVGFVEAANRLGWDGQVKDNQEIERRARERAAQTQIESKRRADELDAMLAEYTTEEVWAAFSRRMTQENRSWWNGRGVPNGWQDYLQLGFTGDKIYRGIDNALYHSPAYTIPYFHTGFDFRTIQYRLENPQRPQDRYRFERDLKATYYQTDPNGEIGDAAIICEGAIKAMVARIYGATDPGIHVLAIPARDTFGGVVDAVKACKRVWVCLDPDCWDKPEKASQDWKPAPVKLAKLIGPAARIVRLVGKVDDMILSDALPANAWKRALKAAAA
jgi:hypothetical protein